MSFALPESMREYIDARVRDGDYGNTSEYLRELIRRDQNEQAAARLRDLGPARIVIVSCEAATLARDVATLLGDASPYRLERVIPFDLFPQTAHVETVSLVVRR